MLSMVFSRRMASNLHLVVQMPQPTHRSSSMTTQPQPRQRLASFLICYSVRVPRRSLKVFLASAALPEAAFCRGAVSKLPTEMAMVLASRAL